MRINVELPDDLVFAPDLSTEDYRMFRCGEELYILDVGLNFAGIEDQTYVGLTKPNRRKEEVIQHLITLSKTNDTYLKSKLCKELNIPAPTMCHWCAGGYFAKRLKELGFIEEAANKKSDKFVFKTI